MTEEVHPPVEEYLEAIWSLEEEGSPVIQARVAKRLGRSVPTVSAMLERLETEGYLNRKPRHLALTPKGRARAVSVVRKHRLAERLLVDIIGLPWYKAHAEAGRWEHVISDEVEKYLVTLLSNPSTCPHGNPIPGALGTADTPGTPSTRANTANPSRNRKHGTLPLSEAAQGTTMTIERVTEEMEMNADALELVDHHGLVPGAGITLTSRNDDGTVLVSHKGITVLLSPWISERIWVTS
ncbi:MAG: metal-dependent transcriptional regulator [Acidimicrobiales bacterium]